MPGPVDTPTAPPTTPTAPAPDPIAAANAALAAKPWDETLKTARLDAFKAKFGSGEVSRELPPPVEYDAHGDELEPLTADPTIASLTPAAIPPRISAIRDLLKSHNEGSVEYRSLQLDLEACYRALHPEDRPGAGAPDEGRATTLAAPAPFTLPALPS